MTTRPWHWFAFRTEPATDAIASSPAFGSDGTPLGFLAARRIGAGRKPAGALGIDARAIDPEGEPAWISLALAPAGTRVLFDDPAICQDMRVVLAGRPTDVMPTLVLDPSTIGGALPATRGSTSDDLADDQFARIFPRPVSRVGRGFVGAMPAAAGPGAQRYSGAPWPWDSW